MGSRAAACVVPCVLVLSMPFLASSRVLIGERDETRHLAIFGGSPDSERENIVEIEELARFAIEEHNKKENTLLKFVRVVKAKEQVAAGTLHRFTLEVVMAKNKKLYEVKVWVKPWLHFKQLQEFKHVTPSVPPRLARIGGADTVDLLIHLARMRFFTSLALLSL